MLGTVELNVQALIEKGGAEINDFFDIEPAFTFGSVMMKLFVAHLASRFNPDHR